MCFVILWHVADKRRSISSTPAQPVLSAAPTQPAPSVQHPQLPALTWQAFSPPRDLTSDPPQEQKSSEPVQPSLAIPPAQPVLQQAATSTSWQELQTHIDSYIRSHGLDRAVGVVSTEHGLVISLSDTITFPSGQATLSPAVAPLLSQVATLATERPDLDIEIAGHTDDRPISTTEFPSNWELSAARASRVTRALLEQGQIDPIRISTRGYAHYRPVQANDTEEHRAANRRVEIRFFHRVKSSD
jgi:chemotaxis protein MotB